MDIRQGCVRRLRDHSDANRSREDATDVAGGLESASLSEVGVVDLAYWVKILITILAVTLIMFPMRNSCNYSEECESNTTDCFSENEARKHLRKVSIWGPRMVGSISMETNATTYLIGRLNDIAHIANSSGLVAEVDQQISDYSGFRTHHSMKIYRNVKNLILRFHDPRMSANSNQSNRTAFLINCHYDSAISSPGASDAFVNCAIMLEVARVLASGTSFLVNDLIFLFNGAEESLLMASHAFNTQHKWASSVVAFLNLEGAAAGGRLFVFQTGPGNSSKFLLNVYSQSFKNRFGSVLGEDIFQSGAIPSDTDFRMFRDYGRVPGLDMAYVFDGYAYHTPYDTEARILPACLQQTGSDVLRFAKLISLDERLRYVQRLPISSAAQNWKIPNASLLTSNEFDNSFINRTFTRSSPHERIVYFDLLGNYFVVVPWWIWKCFNIAVVISFFIWLAAQYSPIIGSNIIHRDQRRKLQGLLLALTFQIVALVSGVLFACGLGWITHYYGYRMSWYSSRYNLIGIFILPFTWWFFWFFSCLCKVPDGAVFRLCSNSVPFFIRINWLHHRPKNNSISLLPDFLDASLIIISLTVLLLSLFDLPSVFILTVWLSLALVARLILNMFTSTSTLSTSSVAILVIILPAYCLFHIFFCANMLDIVIPIVGRSGNNVQPDIIFSILLFFMSIPIILLLTGSIQCTSASASKLIHFLLLNACITYAILVHTSPFGFPYSIASNDSSVSPRHQRVFLAHAHRTLNLELNSSVPTRNESFIFVMPLDTNGVRYLKPDSYPSFLPTAVMKGSPHGGLKELVDTSAFGCNTTLPYCGVSLFSPRLHTFSEFYFIPVEANELDPPINLTKKSVTSVGKTAIGEIWNFTFSLDSGPPHSSLLIRTDPPHVSLTNWSFHAFAPPIPVPIPTANRPMDESDTHVGAHYVVVYINGNFNSPWVFWLLIHLRSDTSPESRYFDLAIGGTYLDESAPSSRSVQLKEFVDRLPAWTTTWLAGSAYKHWRFRLEI